MRSYYERAAEESFWNVGALSPGTCVSSVAIICLEDGDEELVNHTSSFYTDLLRLEDTVLQACVKHLSGKDDPLDTEETGQGGVLVL